MHLVNVLVVRLRKPVMRQFRAAHLPDDREYFRKLGSLAESSLRDFGVRDEHWDAYVRIASGEKDGPGVGAETTASANGSVDQNPHNNGSKSIFWSLAK